MEARKLGESSTNPSHLRNLTSPPLQAHIGIISLQGLHVRLVQELGHIDRGYNHKEARAKLRRL